MRRRRPFVNGRCRLACGAGNTGKVALVGDVVHWVGRSAKRIAVAIVGSTLVIAGLAMLALPGPGLLVVFAGLAVLATEFAWASAALSLARRKAAQAGGALKRRTRRE
jgi:uncharacterized protein (TIGR02611 family)